MCQQLLLRRDARCAPSDALPASAPRPPPRLRNPAPAACLPIFPLPAAGGKEDRWLSTEKDLLSTANIKQSDGHNRGRKTRHMATHDLATRADATGYIQNGAPAPTWPGGVRRGGRIRLGGSPPPGDRMFARCVPRRGGKSVLSWGVGVSSGSRSS